MPVQTLDALYLATGHVVGATPLTSDGRMREVATHLGIAADSTLLRITPFAD